MNIAIVRTVLIHVNTIGMEITVSRLAGFPDFRRGLKPTPGISINRPFFL
jgi:hypothetical protein